MTEESKNIVLELVQTYFTTLKYIVIINTSCFCKPHSKHKEKPIVDTQWVMGKESNHTPKKSHQIIQEESKRRRKE